MRALLLTTLIGAFAAVGFSVHCDPTPPEPTPKIERPELIPWVEINSPVSAITRWGRVRPDIEFRDPDLSYLEHCIDALPDWSTVADRVIVLTQPQHIDTLYPALQQRKPDGLRIIGGVKLYTGLKGDFANSSGWQSVADQASRIVAITGTNIVVLDGETLLTPFHTGSESIDFARLRESLVALKKTGVQFWWHPVRILANTPSVPDREQLTARLVATISEVLPDSVFLTAYTAWHGYEDNDHGEIDLRNKMIALVGRDRIHDRYFPTPDGYWYFRNSDRKRTNTTAETIAEINRREDGGVIDLYPGSEAWVAVAREFALQRDALR